MGASFPDGEAEVGLPAARRIAHAVGAQHSTPRYAALFGDVSDGAQIGAKAG
jgi:hypothetical protein